MTRGRRAASKASFRKAAHAYLRTAEAEHGADHMHVVVRQWKADPTKDEESARKIEEGFVPDVSNIEGFVAYYLVRGEGDKAFTITICEDREAIEESTRRARAFAEREMKGIIQGPPEVLAGEVLVEHAAQRGTKTGARSEVRAGQRG